MLKFGVLRGCGPFELPGAGLVNCVPPFGKFEVQKSAVLVVNMSGLLLPKKSFGDDCQPNSTSLTSVELSVERSDRRPGRAVRVLVRPGRESRERRSALFSVSGLSLYRCR